LQELMQVHVCNRQLGLFLAVAQFSGYTTWSYVFRCYQSPSRKVVAIVSPKQHVAVPLYLYLGLSVLRALDLSMTNMSMAYVNFPAKTLIKSSRVVFTMMFGVLLAGKRYTAKDYAMVLLMVSGLAIFMHADSKASAVLHPIGIIMLVVSLVCDGLISNLAETIMNQYGVGQDEYIYRMHSIALLAIAGAATWRGDLMHGLHFMMQPGTYNEIAQGSLEPSWSIYGKCWILILCFTMGFFGNSCSAAITKNFGALAMTITSTARMATTLFLSFLLFRENTCTMEHVAGIAVFIVTARQLWLGV